MTASVSSEFFKCGLRPRSRGLGDPDGSMARPNSPAARIQRGGSPLPDPMTVRAIVAGGSTMDRTQHLKSAEAFQRCRPESKRRSLMSRMVGKRTFPRASLVLILERLFRGRRDLPAKSLRASATRAFRRISDDFHQVVG